MIEELPPRGLTNAAGLHEVFSIGHSNHPQDRFLQLLADHRIEVVADVRSSPWSKFAPWAARAVLSKELARHGIRYVFLGDELGGRPAGTEFQGVADRAELYRRIEATEFFGHGVERLVRGAEQYRVAMLCSEENPVICHRDRLIRPVLVRMGVAVHHIRGNGKVESHLAGEEESASSGDAAPTQLSLAL